MAVAGTVPLSGAGVPWSGASAGWWIGRPSVSAPGKASGLKVEVERALPRRRVEAGSPDAAKSSLRYPAAGWWIGLSKRQAAVGDDRAGRSLRPSR